MGFISLLSFFILFFLTPQEVTSTASSIIPLLLTIKSSLDPKGLILTSWSPNASTDPCNGSFEGISCNEAGQVVNISLQGKGLNGQIPPEIGQFKSLSGLYLHFNQLHGVVPKEISDLVQLSDLYLNVNNLSGGIPPQLGDMANLQVLQLCYNKFNGSIPNQLGSLKNVNVLALQYNELSGAIPASLGDLATLTRLDLSYNRLFGSIPSKLADSSTLQVLDIRNNTLSGNVPIALKKLNEGFRYTGNPGLCGVGFSSLSVCDDTGLNPTKPEPSEPNSNRLPSKIPESANVQENSFHKPRQPQTITILGVIVLFVIVTFVSIFSFTWYRRRKQKIGSTQTSDTRLSTDRIKEVSRRSASPLINLEYSHSWDPLGQVGGSNTLSQEVFERFTFNLDEVESATKYFSDKNLLGKGSFSAIYKGSLRDGSTVAIKCISKTSCKSDESEFLEGLKLLTSLKHENVLRLRGFCCSKGRGECFLIYDFVPNGNLLKYLDTRNDKGPVLEWSARVLIIKGIAKGIEYLHGNKPALVHRNISAEKVLLGQNYNPMLSDCGVHKLLADDILFSTLKGSAAMGYLAPEYTTTGRFNEKSDVYAFGMIILQILSGKSKVSLSSSELVGMHHGKFVDANLEGKYGEECDVEKLMKIALLCTHENPSRRPAINVVMQELDDIQ